MSKSAFRSQNRRSLVLAPLVQKPSRKPKWRGARFKSEGRKPIPILPALSDKQRQKLELVYGGCWSQGTPFGIAVEMAYSAVGRAIYERANALRKSRGITFVAAVKKLIQEKPTSRPSQSAQRVAHLES